MFYNKAIVRTCILCIPIIMLAAPYFMDSAWSVRATFYFHFQDIGLLGETVSTTVFGERGQYQVFREVLLPGISNQVVEIGADNYFQVGENLKACVKNHNLGKNSETDCDSTRLDGTGTADFYLDVPQN